MLSSKARRKKAAPAIPVVAGGKLVALASELELVKTGREVKLAKIEELKAKLTEEVSLLNGLTKRHKELQEALKNEAYLVKPV